MEQFLSLLLPITLLTVAAVTFLLCAVNFFKRAREQHKLYNSIRLVELKQPRFFLLLSVAVATSLIVIISILIVNALHGIYEAGRLLNMDVLRVRLCLIALIVILVCAVALCMQQFFAKAAIVDRGIYIGYGFIDWHHVYDYHVDSQNCTVILSSNKKGPLVLSGTTLSLKFNRQDIERLEFILSKNRNKFIPGFELR